MTRSRPLPSTLRVLLFAIVLGLLLTPAVVLPLSLAPAQAQSSSDVKISKADSDDPLLAGSLLTYTLTVSNTGATDATNVVATDTLPAEVDFIAAESSQSDCAAPVGRVLTCTLAGDGSLDILLVSSESGVTGYYTEALRALGYDDTVFEASGGSGPTAAVMSDYELVIWAGGIVGSSISDYGDEAELAAYLDGGGRLSIVAQDYH